MATDVIMPQMGESIFEGTITKWLKKPGERVERDEPLFEISTDKVDAEIPAPAAGVLKEIKIAEGQTVPIQTVVAVIDGEGGAAAAPSAAPAAAKSAPAPPPPPPVEAPLHFEAPPRPAAPPPPPVAQPPAPAVAAPPPVRADDEKIRSSPLVRRLARENNIDLATIAGTGAGGRISKNDILSAIEHAPAPAAARPSSPAPAPASAAPPAATGSLYRPAFELGVPRERIYFGRYEVQPMSTMRQKIAEHMLASKHVSPHVYSVEEADVSGIAALRNKAKGEFERKYELKLSFMPFFVRAAIEGLRAYPQMNASLDGTNVVLHKECNIGMAVALDWGLLVPVIKNAEEKNFLGLQRAINDLADRARTKKLKPEEVAESTFAITNPGVFGGLMGMPVINQPNVGILGLGAIQKRPVVIDDAIAIRSMVYLTLSYDHRVVDGAIAHQFLHKVKSVLEDWTENIL
ncbi:MAG TPA: 2-oxoglutarate dehydrogenase, E2 component, dihydrolipoamide succinyltransferase [Candidatus Solibacter sp.]|nr:2-oxoglutarate dehydrogenase, E2 component, dihydrolipoamide succinyltransferase [Candidatus Solibacter sp.]